MTTPADLIALEDKWVGTVEDPPGSNRTFIGDNFGWTGVPWCAETQSLAIAEVFGRRIFWSASVAEWIAAAKNGTNGLRWVDAGWQIEAGMLATFDFGSPRGNPAHFHISLVRDPGTQDKFQTDGGNEGDAMRQQWRDRTYVQGFIALPYDTDEEAMTPELQAALDKLGAGIAAVDERVQDIRNQIGQSDGDDASKWTGLFGSLRKARRAVKKNFVLLGGKGDPEA